jgi:4-amino-4-deoxy-L-arabinose transferase-like glycosyltransferase
VFALIDPDFYNLFFEWMLFIKAVQQSMGQQKQSSARVLTRNDVIALAALAVFFILNLAGTWQRWTQPLIDHGREMNLPTRILSGEQLYIDIQFLYGPFAPYFNATLYRIFGIHLTTLKVSGALCAILISLLVYWLSRQLMSVWEAALTTGVVIVICALKSTANYVQPYAYAALYALVFGLVSLASTVNYLRLRQKKWIILSGVFVGMVLITKPEVTVAAMSAAVLALLLESIDARRLLWREASLFALPVLIITSSVYGMILSRVPLRVLLNDNHILFTNMPQQLVYFNQYVSGIGKWPMSLWYTLTGVGIFALWSGGSAVLGTLVSARKQEGWSKSLRIGGLVLMIGVIFRVLAVEIFGVSREVTPFASAVIVLPSLIGIISSRMLQTWRNGGEISSTHKVLLVISIFGFISILRAIINVTIISPYTPFFLPTLIIIYLYLLFRVSPQIFTKTDSIRLKTRYAAMWLIAILVIGMSINSVRRLRIRDTFLVSAPRGSFYAEPYFAQPVAEAVKYVREHSSPGEYVLTLPQGTTINFLAERPYPLREEIIHPGFLAGETEIETIERIKSHNVRLIVVANILTPEFRDRIFGAEYNQELMDWITDNYHKVAHFEIPPPSKMKPTDVPFFIVAYERNR